MFLFSLLQTVHKTCNEFDVTPYSKILISSEIEVIKFNFHIADINNFVIA